MHVELLRPGETAGRFTFRGHAMFRVTAGETISRQITVAGSGTLAEETFAATVRDQIGHVMRASAEITSAAARQVTVSVSAAEWRRGEGGFGRLEVTMDNAGAKSVVAAERFRVMPGQGVTATRSDAYAGWNY